MRDDGTDVNVETGAIMGVGVGLLVGVHARAGACVLVAIGVGAVGDPRHVVSTIATMCSSMFKAISLRFVSPSRDAGVDNSKSHAHTNSTVKPSVFVSCWISSLYAGFITTTTLGR